MDVEEDKINQNSNRKRWLSVLQKIGKPLGSHCCIANGYITDFRQIPVRSKAAAALGRDFLPCGRRGQDTHGLQP